MVAADGIMPGMRNPLCLIAAFALAGGMPFLQAAIQENLATAQTRARAADGKYISWREHLIDDEALGGIAIRGGDGLKIADLDKDGYADIVSVHEADTQYDGALSGYIRIAFGTNSPDRWVLT